MLKNGKIKNVN